MGRSLASLRLPPPPGACLPVLPSVAEVAFQSTWPGNDQASLLGSNQCFDPAQDAACGRRRESTRSLGPSPRTLSSPEGSRELGGEGPKAVTHPGSGAPG